MIVYPELILKRSLPSNYIPDHCDHYRVNKIRSLSVQINTLKNVVASNELFLRYRHHLSILKVSFGDDWQDSRYNSIPYKLKHFAKDLLRRTVHLQSGCWILDQYSTGGYYHWLTEILPRIYIFTQTDYLQNECLYFPEYFFEKFPFGVDLIKPFDISFSCFTERHKLVFDRLYSISKPGGPIAFQPNLLRLTIANLKVYYLQAKGLSFKGRRIYLTRRSTGKRNVLNDVSVCKMMVEKGFEIIDCDALSISQQINIFDTASVLCSIHGAGLTNMVFMKPGSIIIELRSPITNNMAA